MPALPSLYIAMRMSKVAFGRCYGLSPSFFYHWPPFRLFLLDHPRWPLFSYDDVLTLGRLNLRRPNQDLLPIELDHVHVCWEWVLVELHLGTFYKFQSTFVYGRLNPLIENIAIISSMRIRIIPFTIRMLFELFR
jgi:hypothetical protein